MPKLKVIAVLADSEKSWEEAEQQGHLANYKAPQNVRRVFVEILQRMAHDYQRRLAELARLGSRIDGESPSAIPPSIKKLSWAGITPSASPKAGPSFPRGFS